MATKKKPKLGSGKRFASIEKKAAKEYGSKAAGKRVAAAIGRKAHGAKKMAAMAAAGRKRAAKASKHKRK